MPDFDFSVEHVLMFMIAILLLLILFKKNNTCQRICNNGFKVGGQPAGFPLFGGTSSLLAPPPPPPPPPPRRPPFSDIECNGFYSQLANICPPDHVDNRCCNGTNTIYGLNSLRSECISPFLDSTSAEWTQMILNNYNTCQDNFPDISAENTIFTFFTDEDGIIPSKYVSILQNLERIRRKTGKKTYEIITGSNLRKYNRFLNYIKWSKENNMKIYGDVNDSDGFTVGAQWFIAGGTAGAGLMSIYECYDYFTSEPDIDENDLDSLKGRSSTQCSVPLVLFMFGGCYCFKKSNRMVNPNLATQATGQVADNLNERLAVQEFAVRDTAERIQYQVVQAEPLNFEQGPRPPTIVSQELQQARAAQGLDPLDESDLLPQVDEVDLNAPLLATDAEDTALQVQEGEVLQILGEEGEVDIELAGDG